VRLECENFLWDRDTFGACTKHCVFHEVEELVSACFCLLCSTFAVDADKQVL
jgi:hypothetical protein